MTTGHDCAQVERDCIALHLALAEAVRRIVRANELLYGSAVLEIRVQDLAEVLDRTAQPMPFVPHVAS